MVHFCRKRHPLTLVTCRRPFRGIMVRMDEAIRTRCCIAGGGPAGMMLALLLARMGEEDNTTNGRNYLGWYGKLPTDRGTAANWPIALQPSR